MSKIVRRAPARRIARKMLDINNTGNDGIVVIRAADDPVTLVRILLDFVVFQINDDATVQLSALEIWRKSNSTGAALPTADTSGDILYADNKDLIWRGEYGTFLPLTINENVAVQMRTVVKDMKAMRKLDRDEDLVFRFIGDADVLYVGNCTTFYKEV